MKKIASILVFIFAAVVFYRPELTADAPFSYFYLVHAAIFLLSFMAINRCFKNAEMIRTHKELKSLGTRSKPNKFLGYVWYLLTLLAQIGVAFILLSSFHRAGILQFYQSGIPIMQIAPGAWLSFSSVTVLIFVFITSFIEKITTTTAASEKERLKQQSAAQLNQTGE